MCLVYSLREVFLYDMCTTDCTWLGTSAYMRMLSVLYTDACVVISSTLHVLRSIIHSPVCVYKPMHIYIKGKGNGPSRMMAITIDPVTGKSRVLDTDLNTGNTTSCITLYINLLYIKQSVSN